jgi:3-isopropylmalate/(R)-2-methylmalate dehydratase small subunit
MGLGLRAVIAESFGDIFYNNCFQNGMLPIVLPRAELDRLACAALNGAPCTVDLVTRQVRSPSGETIAFEIDPQRRQALLEGLDEIAGTLKRESEIAAWQTRDRDDRPWIWTFA